MAFKKLTDALKHFEENSGSGDRNEFFQLVNDRDTAVVRFLHEGEEDLDWYIVHQVEIEGKKRWVKCLENRCPACEAGNRAQLKIFLQLLDKRDGKQKTWERGQKFIPKIISNINRYGNLCSRPYEIERNGKKGDTKTDYQLFPLDADNKTLADLPKRQELLGERGFILDRNAADVKKMVEGTFKYEPVAGTHEGDSQERTEQSPPPTERREKSNTDYF